MTYRMETTRKGKAYVAGYVPVASKQKLAAVATLRGETLSELLRAFAERVDVLAPLLPEPAGRNGKAER